MTPLELVKPLTSVTWNGLLYGPPKGGKTIGAVSAPGPLLHINADSRSRTRAAHQLHEFDEIEFKGLKTFEDVREETRETTKYKTVVLDPVGDVYRILVEESSNKALNPQLGMYKDAGTHIERFCRGMCSRDVNFIVVAHDMNLGEGQDVERLPFTGSATNPTLGRKIMAMVDVVAFCAISTGEGEEPKYLGQLVNAHGRRGGDGFKCLGQYRDLDLTEWSERIAESIEKPKEAKAA